VLANESHARFDKLYQSYIDRYQPADEVEMGLVNEMVAARWRQQRLWMIQTAGIDLEMDRMQEQLEKTMLQCPEPTRISIAFTWMANKGKAAELLTRCETTYSRMHDRAMKALKRLQEDRMQIEGGIQQEEPIEPAKEPTTSPVAEPVHSTTSNTSQPENQKLGNDANTEPTASPTHPDNAPPEPPPARDNVCTELKL
jgi:hypothetical protein